MVPYNPKSHNFSFLDSPSSLSHLDPLSHLLSRLGLSSPQTSDKMADTTVTVSAQEKGPDGQVSTPAFAHPLADQATGDDVLVDFDGPLDPYNPMNWPFKKKVLTTLLYCFATSWITFASAVYTAALVPIAHEFHVGYEVSTLGISLFIIGFAIGPMVFSPLSEVYGRKFIVLVVRYSPVVITRADSV